MDNTSKSIQKMLRTILWIISVLLVVSLGIGIFSYIPLFKENENIKKSIRQIDEVFTRLDNLSPPLSSSARMFFNKKRAAYLRGRYQEEKTLFNSVNYGGWSSGDKYYDYALSQYNLGYPEDFLEGIKECIKSNSLKQHPQATIKAAFELGLFDDCRKLIEIYSEARQKDKEHTPDEFDNELIRITGKLNEYTHLDNETNLALAAPFTGTWQYEENGDRIVWEITGGDYPLCRYLFQTKDGEQWVDNDITVTRYQFKQMDGKTILEAYNVRNNVLTVSEIALIADNELNIKEKETIRMYTRIMENKQ
jgi:hypothetical protein